LVGLTGIACHFDINFIHEEAMQEAGSALVAILGLCILFGGPVVYVVWAFWTYDPKRYERVEAKANVFYSTVGIYVRALLGVIVVAIVLVFGFQLVVGASASLYDWINSLTVRGLLMIIVVLLVLLLLRMRR
jgi:hypothetical protein